MTMPLMVMKISLSVKTAAFIASIIFMSWSFAGYRAIQQAPTLSNLCVLLAAVLATVLMLAVQGYWIYVEEMDKGTLRRKIVIFDRIHSWLGHTQEKRT
jgi:hypothetical protein